MKQKTLTEQIANLVPYPLENLRLIIDSEDYSLHSRFISRNDPNLSSLLTEYDEIIHVSPLLERNNYTLIGTRNKILRCLNRKVISNRDRD